MFFKPFADRGNGTLAGSRGRVRSMKDPDFTEKHNGNPTASPFADLCPQLHKKSFDVPPWQVAADRPRKEQLEGALVLSPHDIDSTTD